MKREHAIEAHEILDVLKSKYPGTYDEILKLVDLSDDAFEMMMGSLQEDRSNKSEADSLDRTLLFALAALGNTDAVLELGHFGQMTQKEAVVRLKTAREGLKKLQRKEN